MRIIDISAEMLSAPVYPGDPMPRLAAVKALGRGEECNLSVLQCSVHAGTHVDAPLHFIEGGTGVAQMPLTRFMGPCRVMTVYEPVLTGADIDNLRVSGIRRLLFKGFGKVGLTRSAAFALAAEGIELVGIDAPSIAVPEEEAAVHRELLTAGIVILEGLDLSAASGGAYTLYAPPLKIAGAEGAMCRAVLLSNEE